MPQYLLAVHMNPDAAPPAEEDKLAAWAAVDVFNDKLQQGGHWVFAGGLMPVDTATVIDATGEETLVTDGPFSETKEHLGGFWVIEAKDLDEAKRLAAEGSAACRQPVEVRPFQGE